MFLSVDFFRVEVEPCLSMAWIIDDPGIVNFIVM